jgi:hypothetical protein
LSGIPFFVTTPFALGIVEQGQQILGGNLIAFQAGNEPNLYGRHPETNRPAVGNCVGLSIDLSNGELQGYGPLNYMSDIGLLVSQVAAEQSIMKKNDLFVIPSISSSVWLPDDVWSTGIVGTYSSSLHALALEQCVQSVCPIDT